MIEAWATRTLCSGPSRLRSQKSGTPSVAETSGQGRNPARHRSAGCCGGRHPVEDFRRRQAPTLHLLYEVAASRGRHAQSPFHSGKRKLPQESLSVNPVKEVLMCDFSVLAAHHKECCQALRAVRRSMSRSRSSGARDARAGRARPAMTARRDRRARCSRGLLRSPHRAASSAS